MQHLFEWVLNLLNWFFIYLFFLLDSRCTKWRSTWSTIWDGDRSVSAERHGWLKHRVKSRLMGVCPRYSQWKNACFSLKNVKRYASLILEILEHRTCRRISFLIIASIICIFWQEVTETEVGLADLTSNSQLHKWPIFQQCHWLTAMKGFCYTKWANTVGTE